MEAHQRAEKAEEELTALRRGNEEAMQIEREHDELLPAKLQLRVEHDAAWQDHVDA